MGFCFFNNVAIAARHALDVHGLQRVAIIDFDVHHGNGTEDIIAGDERMLMCSFFQHPLYPYSGAVPKGTNMVNVPVPPYTRGPSCARPSTRCGCRALEEFAPQMIFISAGFDAHREDDLGQLGLVEADYEWITRAEGRGRPPRPGPHRVVPGRRLQPERAGAQRGGAPARAGRHGVTARRLAPAATASPEALPAARQWPRCCACADSEPSALLSWRRRGRLPGCWPGWPPGARLQRCAAREPQPGSIWFGDGVVDGVLFPVLALLLALLARALGPAGVQVPLAVFRWRCRS
jgi:hypothetical protein